MNDNMSGFSQLNEYICWYIQNNGWPYVVDNYCALREQYYSLTSQAYVGGLQDDKYPE